MNYRFGLIGKSLKHSFSKDYFTDKFHRLGLPYTYDLFEIQAIDEIKALLELPNLIGLNVTVPYKEAVLAYVDEYSEEVSSIRAANVLCREGDLWKAYNTDAVGFEQSLFSWLGLDFRGKGMVIGNGGASKAVQWVLKKHQIPFYVLVRTMRQVHEIAWEYAAAVAKDCNLWINTTPIGMYPNISEGLDLPYHLLTPHHYVYDLIYNPSETSFMSAAQKMGAKAKNGLDMLYKQADAAWNLWQKQLN